VKEAITIALAVIGLYVLAYTSQRAALKITIQFYRDAFSEKTEGLTDEQITKLDDFKNIY